MLRTVAAPALLGLAAAAAGLAAQLPGLARVGFASYAAALALHLLGSLASLRRATARSRPRRAARPAPVPAASPHRGARASATGEGP
jgi:hypothetical protein